MREIRFRAKDIFTDKWVYGDLVHNKKVTTTGLAPRIMVGGYEVKEDTIGQFTGLHDKNGEDIYEGDIVVMPRVPEKRRKSVLTRHIVTSNSVFSWVFKSLTEEVLPLDMSGHTNFDSYKFDVIGNIHDNPELVELVSLDIQEQKQQKERQKDDIQVEFVVKDNPKRRPQIERTEKRGMKIVFEVTREEMDKNIVQTIKNKRNNG